MSTEPVVAAEPGPVASAVDPAAGAELRTNSVGLAGVVGQSLSAMGLSGVIGTSVPVVAIIAGAGARRAMVGVDAHRRPGCRRHGVHPVQELRAFPGWPTNLVTGLFLGTTVVICAIYERLRRSHSPVLAQIGKSVDEGDGAEDA